MNNPGLNYKSLFSKWLLAVILLLSFFTFPGIASQRQAKSTPSQTEAAYFVQKQAVKSVTYQRVLKQAQSRQNELSIFAASAIDLAYFDSLLIKIFSVSYSSKNISKLQNTFIYQHKSTTQNKSDEPAIASV